MKTKIVTCIYFDLHGTELGGRPSRNEHYLYSLNSIMKIDTADFIIYTNNKNKVLEFYERLYPNKLDKFQCIEYDLHNTEYKDLINPIKNVSETRLSTRCIELQYSKFTWLKQSYSNDLDYLYWIDAGLCYSGLLPDKLLKTNTGNYSDTYYGSDYFTNNFVDNLNKFSKDKIMVCAKENVKNYWDRPLPEKYFTTDNFSSEYHIIGGLFGGKAQLIESLYEKFYSLTRNLIDQEKFLYHEENILSCLYFSYPNIFVSKNFDIWWHEDNIVGNVGEEKGINLLKNNKSFYKILEELF